MDPEQISGSPLEKMVLMLNDKADKHADQVAELSRELRALWSYLQSEELAIPWATNQVSYHPYCSTVGAHRTNRPSCVSEWRRRGWDVWRVTTPSSPDTPPYFTIKKKGAILPESVHQPPVEGHGYFIPVPVKHELVKDDDPIL